MFSLPIYDRKWCLLRWNNCSLALLVNSSWSSSYAMNSPSLYELTNRIHCCQTFSQESLWEDCCHLILWGLYSRLRLFRRLWSLYTHLSICFWMNWERFARFPKILLIFSRSGIKEVISSRNCWVSERRVVRALIKEPSEWESFGLNGYDLKGSNLSTTYFRLAWHSIPGNILKRFPRADIAHFNSSLIGKKNLYKSFESARLLLATIDNCLTAFLIVVLRWESFDAISSAMWSRKWYWQKTWGIFLLKDLTALTIFLCLSEITATIGTS